MSKQTTTVSSVLVEASDDALDAQRADGSMPAGHNGPYSDLETPVRNTSHWLLTFLYAYEATGDERFSRAARDSIDYLLSEAARPHGATFHHRESDTKDGCNGVVGQAWTIEALARAAEVLDRDDLLDVAEEVFLLHPFHESLGLWKQVEVDGSVLSFDATFNHQLWFAAAGSLLAQHDAVSEEVTRRVTTFLDRLERIVSIAPSGLIWHRSVPAFAPSTAVDLAREDVKLFLLSALEWTNLIGNRALDAYFDSELAPVRRAPISGDAHVHKSIGYHSFNLYAMALLYESFPQHDFWSSETFESILSYVDSHEYVEGLQDNEFGYAYNPPGIEVAYALHVFRGDASRNEQKIWLARQFERTYDPENGRLARNNPDPTTLTARLYEATRLPDLEFSLDVTEPAPEPSP